MTHTSTKSPRSPKPGSKPAAELPLDRVLVGDALHRLRGLPANSIDAVVTSPPYFLLRNYGVKGQIGAEDSVHEWVDRLVAVLDEVARVLKPGGSVWLNLGDTYSRHLRHGALPKSLLLAPERLTIALVDAGWRVRNKVVWAKPNPMPTSVADRLATTWEPLLLLTRENDVYFDLDAIRVPAVSAMNRPAKVGRERKYTAEPGVRPEWSGPLAGSNVGLDRMKARGENSHPLGKNPGDVWTLATAAYRGAHFATFPEALVERPLLATCPARVCIECGSAWRRAAMSRTIGGLAIKGALRKSCSCASREWQPGVVLDPFFGAGTVGVVAKKLGRRWIGVELNPAFATLARQRVATEEVAA
jgi:DNA modification methylase